MNYRPQKDWLNSYVVYGVYAGGMPALLEEAIPGFVTV